MKNITTTEVRTSKEGFNNQPTRTELVSLLTEKLGEIGAHYEVADLEEKRYWQNTEDTLVLLVDQQDVWRYGADHAMQFAIGLADFVTQSACDEFHQTKVGNKVALRFWWD